MDIRQSMALSTMNSSCSGSSGGGGGGGNNEFSVAADSTDVSSQTDEGHKRLLTGDEEGVHNSKRSKKDHDDLHDSAVTPTTFKSATKSTIISFFTRK